jgi:tetratricopeptide (TPR) repeat protein
VLFEALGSWLVGQLTDAIRRRLGAGLLGGEQERALRAAGQAAIMRAARELRPGASGENVEYVARIMDEVFQMPAPVAPAADHATLLQALQAGIAAQLALLGDPTLTGTGQSSAQVLDLPVEQITETLIRNIVREILLRGAGGGPLAPLAAQLNHDLTHLQGQRTAGMLERVVQQLAQLTGRLGQAAPAVPQELPRTAADFTGRADELAVLRRWLTADPAGTGGAGRSATEGGWPGPTCVIDGMGGIGKSALAIQAANQLAERFPDGQLYVNLQGATPGLAPLDPLEALGRMLRALGHDPTQIPDEFQEAAARFRSRAAGRRLLIVLDNADSAQQVRPLLPGSPTCAVLVTSRRALVTLEGVDVLHLDALPEPQALTLLGRVAGTGRVAAEPQAAAALVGLCGRMPLAIRIAGSRLAARPAWPVRLLADLLADTGRRLEELAIGELAVRASFEVSLHALQDSPDPVDRTAVAAFGLLSLPDGPDLSVTVAARLLDQTEPATQTVLERLVDAQLLETPQPGRYQFHDLLRLYARQRAAGAHPEPERLAALTRTLAFYTATAWHTLALLRPGDHRLATADPQWTRGGQQLADTAAAALAWLERERANLLAAITQAAAAAPAVPAELAGQLTRALSAFFDRRGYWHDAAQANQTVLALTRRTHDQVGQAYTHNDLGFAYRRLGRHSEAIASLNQGLALSQELNDLSGQAYSLGSLGSVYAVLRRYQEAIALQRQSLAIWRELGDTLGQATNLVNLGNIYRALGRYQEATASLEESLTIWRQRGDRRGRATSLGLLGVVYRQLGQPTKALACHQESLSLSREVGDRRGQAISLNDLGVIYGQLAQPEKALAHLQESLTVFQELGHRTGQMRVLRDLGDVLQLAGRQQQARAAWREAQAIAQTLGIPEAQEILARLNPQPPDTAPPASDR